MKATLSASDLTAALARASRVVPRKTTNPILANVLLTVRGGTLEIAATNLNVWATTALDADVIVDGAATVNASDLAGIVGKLDPKTALALEASSDGSLALRCGKYSGRLRTLPARDFPEPAAPTGARVLRLAAKELAAAFAVVTPCISTERGRALDSVYLHAGPSGALRMVAMDGRRFARADLVCDGAQGFPGMILPEGAVAAFSAMAGKAPTGDAEISANTKRAVFRLDAGEIATTLLAPPYPAYAQHIPTGQRIHADIARLPFIAALDLVMAAADEKYGRKVRLEFSADSVEIFGSTPASKDELGASGTGATDASLVGAPTLVVGVNGCYLLSHLRTLTSAVVRMKFGAAGKAIVLEDADNQTIELAISPMNVGPRESSRGN
jgi:DNA polymerase III subunit beta